MHITKRLHGLAFAAASLAVSAPSVAQAQDEDYRMIVTIMRACAQIDDINARVTCYDNNIIPRPGIAAPPSEGGGSPVQPPPAASASAAGATQDFGAENLPRQREEQRRNQIDQIEQRVSSSAEVEPGVYLLTLDDGSQWRFTESMGLSYDPPSARSQVRIERGALGSYRLHFADQRAVRVQRVR